MIVNVIGDELKKDWQGTLRTVAEIGYDNLEFSGYYGDNREQFKKFMKDIGLKPLSAGSSLGQMKKEDALKKMIDDALYLEKKYLVCYWPWMDSGDNKKLDDFKKAADEMNKLGEQVNKAGLRFAFHNHDKEFVEVAGYKWGYEVFLKETDPSKVAMLLDLYWITKGGGDPVQLLQQYPKRFELFHVKDMDKTSEKSFTCPGYGIIDFKRIFAEAKKAGVKHYIVEIDKAPNPMQCIKDSYAYLNNLRF
ncbi:sugar phosphate isomerase/epimerase family protein [Segetibacter aerophilus]|uniref:Sugar phosphate isomerase n=1 Tax=Segetibacter aerophilus TaxID=670293 RepID=A0A512BIU8_9BACT|nr:sugar phosphate isomerase/epimerase [Segetibacter aerophilus]GEO11891.1 sugar phosphate isomerase [Segetibacter aerophilus]